MKPWSNFTQQAHILTPLFVIFYCMIPIGIATSILVTRTDPQAAFYYMPLRAWQFSAGAVSFHLSTTESALPRFLRKSHPNSIGLVGLTIIAISLFLIDKNSAYPGIWSTLPTLATTLLLCVCTEINSGFTFRMLSNPLSPVDRKPILFIVSVALAHNVTWSNHTSATKLSGQVVTDNRLTPRVSFVVRKLLKPQPEEATGGQKTHRKPYSCVLQQWPFSQFQPPNFITKYFQTIPPLENQK
ncbi:MAG: hypothetical protein R3F04_09120 [Lysobacteraceae bacterium]